VDRDSLWKAAATSWPRPTCLPAKAERALLDDVVRREPSPEFLVQVAEECSRLLDLLRDDRLRSIADVPPYPSANNAEVTQPSRIDVVY
jgi:hypothetical protein